jgi:Xaa-Pro dipeptidase
MNTLNPVHLASRSRRQFFRAAGVLSAAAFAPQIAGGYYSDDGPALPRAFSGLKPLADRVHPIAPDEFRQRIEQAQRLMADAPAAPSGSPSQAARYDALFFAPGTSLYYFTGIRWGLSERLVGLVIPRVGHPVLVVPAFEEGRLREKLHLPLEVRIWQEDQSPTKIAAAALADQNIRTGRIGIEETTGFTFFDHLRNAAPGFEYASADPVTIACRKEGMSQDDIAHLVEAGFAKMKLHGGALVLLGASAALPHGTLQPQKLREGDVVLIDGGCGVEGYASDVTRTSVYGKPTEKISRAFELVRKSQDAALDAARAGRLSSTVDDAARAVIVNGGYGPDYKFFTHRLGHGIGLDGHEHPYLVRGSKTILEPGMTFSNEPGIYVPGEFGLRCEDDMVIAPDGPAQLLTPGFAPSLEKPFA